jgi:hypothetical protein
MLNRTHSLSDVHNPSPSRLSTAALLRTPAANSERKSHVLSCDPCGIFLHDALLGLTCGTTDESLSLEWHTKPRQPLYAALRLQGGQQRPAAVGPRIERDS